MYLNAIIVASFVGESKVRLLFFFKGWVVRVFHETEKAVSLHRKTVANSYNN